MVLSRRSARASSAFVTPGVAWSCASCEPGSCGRVVVEAGVGAVVDVGAVDGGATAVVCPLDPQPAASSSTARGRQHPSLHAATTSGPLSPRIGSLPGRRISAWLHATPLVVAEGRSVRPPGTVHAAGSDTFNNVRGQSRRCNTTLSSAEYTVSVASSSR